MCSEPASGGSFLPADANKVEAQLNLAIQEERYEDAAKLRDALRAQGGPTNSSPNAFPNGAVGRPAGVDGESASDVRERLRQREISRLRDIDPGGDNMATPF